MDLAAEFALSPEIIYLNHAAVAPWPRRTADAVARFAAENAREGARHYPRWLGVEQQLRERLARLIGGAPADVALLKNTSEAISVVAFGFPWQAGDNVVLAAEEFPSNRIPWQALSRLGVECRLAHLTGAADPERALLDLFDHRTRVLAVSSVQYGNGLRMDLERLGAACRTRGVALCVDAIQSLGALAFDVEAVQADFVMADGHKWLLGPEGLALLWVRPEWRERLALYQYGWHMTREAGDFDALDWRPADDARRFECGSPNLLGAHGLEASLSLLQEIGSASVAEAVLERSGYLMDRIAARGELELLSDARPGRRSGIVTFRHRDIDTATLHRRLTEAGVVCAPRGGGVRLSPHFYTPLEQLDVALAAIPA
ncbi:aminotransferase class V-fold PLP-dependent enzyme [Immundisolibacter sp.]|uniref:aminotransferase class V-fold PLP-dependent enzyme n=1 Tax=Immundisolibacter sp. TaxID=1934948 RepID=UPI00262702BC|nr:aminotransferase class V-fold PLP-dependent enzyme [Immundisolibacter sp.]MDD3652172.1 aminotransferase class V-fold PLP-dependent enzyme [Immundisolibacter sp.]